MYIGNFIRMKKRGFFIVFEGIDGSGKSIHIKYLSQELKKKGYRIVITKEPSKGQVGNFLHSYVRQQQKRLLPKTEVLLFTADRFEHVKKIIEPALKVGKIVISDRYYHSSLAYQGASGVTLEWIQELNQFAPKPDLCILLDILPDYSLYRTNRKRTVFEDVDFLRKVREIYRQYALKGKLIQIDADKPRKAVQAEIFSLVQELLEGER